MFGSKRYIMERLRVSDETSPAAEREYLVLIYLFTKVRHQSAQCELLRFKYFRSGFIQLRRETRHREDGDVVHLDAGA